ncbi:MAG: hypothetical protein ACPLW7_00240 [Minisyncoccia bacterium]
MTEKYLLKIRNIGGIKGSKNFELKMNHLNVLLGQNSKGKSSVAKALMLVNGMDQEIIKGLNQIKVQEANNLGLVLEKGNLRAGIIHAEADFAEVELKNEKILKQIKLKKNGEIEIYNIDNTNFLITSVLTPSSWIFKAVSNPSDIKNESIFSYYISKLNTNIELLKGIEDIFNKNLSVLNQKLIEFKKQKSTIPTIKKELETLEKEIKKLKEERDNYIKSLETNKNNTLKKQIEDLKNKLKNKTDEREEKLKYIQILRKNIEKLKTEIYNNKENINKLEKQRENLINRKKELQKQILSFNREEINSKIEELNKKRYELQGLTNIFYSVLDVLKNENDVLCPVCRVGHINAEITSKNLQDLKKQIENIEMQIRELTNKKLDIEIKEKEEKNIDEEIKKIENDINSIKGLLITKLESELNNTENLLKNEEEKLNELNDDIFKLENILKENNPEIINKINELSYKIEIKSKEYMEKDSKLKLSGFVEYENIRMDLDIAIKKFEHLIDLIQKSKKKIENIREEAKKKIIDDFNSLISRILSETKLSEFKKIYFDGNYVLNVQYIGLNNQIKTMQPYALSESERVLVSLIFLLVLNKTFANNKSIIIIDNIYEYLDKLRENEVFQFLENYAQSEGVTILITKTDNTDDLIITNWEKR